MEQKSRKNIYQQGITLIALVITIVVMLILAGVVINTVTGDEGIIARAKYSNQQQIEKEHIDAIKIAMSGADIEAEINGTNTKGTVNTANIKTELLKKFDNVDDIVALIGDEYKITIDGKTYRVKANREVEPFSGPEITATATTQTSRPTLPSGTTTPSTTASSTSTATPVVTNTPTTQTVIITNKLNGRLITINSDNTLFTHTYNYGGRTLQNITVQFNSITGSFFETTSNRFSNVEQNIGKIENNVLTLYNREPNATGLLPPTDITTKGTVTMLFEFTDGTTDTDTFQLDHTLPGDFNSTANTITFTIDGVTFTANEGDTWQTWGIDSTQLPNATPPEARSYSRLYSNTSMVT